MEEHERIFRLNAGRRLLNATTNSDQNNATAYVDSTALRETLKTYGSAFLVVLAVFCILQNLFPRSFAVRSWSDPIRCDLALINFGVVSWLWKVFWVSDDDVQDQCGMDTLCFFRMLRFGRMLALVGCFNAIWLLPLYRISDNESPVAQASASKPFATISIIHVPSGSKRLVGTVVAAYILFLYAMWLVLKEFEWYTRYRHRFLQKRLARNYAVYVSGIPEEYRSSHKLADYFRRCCAREKDVLEAHCTLNIPNLENKVAKYNAMQQKLEHAQALQELRGSTITSFSVGRHGFEVVESVRKLQQELNTLEREIAAASSRRLREHDRFLSGLQRDNARGNLATALSTEDDTNDVESTDAPGTTKCICCGHFNEANVDVDSETIIVETIQPPHDEENSESQRSDSDFMSLPQEVQDSHQRQEELSKPILKTFTSVLNEVKPDKLKRHIQRAGEYGVHNVKKAGIHGVHHVKRAGEMGVENVLNIAELGTNIVENAVGTAVTIVVGHEEGSPREAGFVVFTKLYAVHSALQMIHHPTPHVMEVSEAPEPDEIFWRNVGLPIRARRLGGYLSLAASAMLCFFWSIPVAFISSLSQVSSLEQSIPFLKKWLKKWPGLAQVLAQVAPLLLYLLNQFVLPGVLTEFSKWEGHIGSSNLEASVFLKMSAFMIVQTFFVSAISGSIAAELSNIIDDPGQIIDLLANSLPGQSSYFLQIILVGTFSTLALTLLRVGPLIQAWIRTKIGPRVTEKERKKTWWGLHPLGHPPDFQQGQNTAQFIIGYMVTFVYATIAPITSCFLFVCFILIESVHRLEFFRNFPVTSDSGGKLWMGFINIMIVCMIFAQLTLVGFLALKKAVAAFPLMLPLIVITVLFFIFINDRHFKVASTLPTSACLELDRRNDEGGSADFRFVHRKYLQPALKSSCGREC